MTAPSLSPEEWARVQELFLDALERPAMEREAFLREGCGGNDRLRAEAASLLAAHERGGPIEEPPPGAPSTEPRPPGTLQWIGPYRLVVELGQGGMGSVYLAEREGEGFTQRVALKLMRADYADSRVAAQLEAERRILARLEHPGIARFIDGGTTPSRQPYIAMEFVDGTPLLEYCTRQGLDVRRRVALFAEVCDAVQYAHGQLVVHRDLKPGNVMVTRDGSPKLLDFGVATVLSDVPRDPARQTANWLTPAYAAPEQLRREPVTTRTDVYALGVILYELLTDERPHDMTDWSWESILRTVTERVPDRPSERAHRTGRPGLARLLAGDLDVIILKALAKEPGRRYGSAEQLGDDLRRWLRGDPVRAQPDTLAYRTGKFVRRHRTLVTLGAIAAVSLVGGIATTIWQARIAREERDIATTALRRSEDVTSFLVGLFEASDPRGGADTLTSRALLQTGLQRVDRLADQPLVQAAMLDALGRVLVGKGQPGEGLSLHERSGALREATLGANHPDLAISHRNAAIALRFLARYGEAEARLKEALRLETLAYGAGSIETTETLLELGFLLPYLGRLAEAESVYRRANAIQARVLGPSHIRTLQSLIVVGVRTRDRDLGEAERILRDVIARARDTTEEVVLIRALAMLHLGDLLHDGRGETTEPERLFRGALSLQRSRLGDRNLALGHGLGALADVRAHQGDYEEALALIRERSAINSVLLGAEHPTTIMDKAQEASVLEMQGRYAEAVLVRKAVLARLRQATGGEHAGVADQLHALATDAAKTGDDAGAERLLREALALRSRLHGPDHQLVYWLRGQLARVLGRLGRYAEAEAEARAAAMGLAAKFSPDHQLVRGARDILAEVEGRKAGR